MTFRRLVGISIALGRYRWGLALCVNRPDFGVFNVEAPYVYGRFVVLGPVALMLAAAYEPAAWIAEDESE